MNLRKALILGSCIGLLLFMGCKAHVDPGNGGNENPGTTTDTTKDINPTISSTASVSQDFIFNTDSVGFTTITIRRSEWNKMLTYYDYFYKNENSVIAESYEYEKDGKKWKLNTVGMRLRGNTSRYRPQGKDYPTDEIGNIKPNYGWDNKQTGYYHSYSTTCDDNTYRQSHFKIDFEPYDDDDRKMSDCMKGVALKRPDSYFSKEIFCYYLFHKYGIWTAPRASQTKVYINIVEDVAGDGSRKEDISKCQKTEIDFGVYEMFEEVNKQSLKGRMSKKGNNSASTAWANNDGDLWKCSGGDLTSGSAYVENFGVEDIKIVDTTIPKSEWLKQPNQNISWVRPNYDLKTNKTSVDTAAVKFKGFISELNELANYDKDTQAGIDARKAFYEKWFDVDFFIKTYAVNILVGMDDDYWGNANNYYLYFDNGKKGTGKCYLIPFDYDNTMGGSINRDKVYVNPLEWGVNENTNTHELTKCNRPLLDRLLEVPEYLDKMKAALLEVSSQDADSPWNKNNCFDLWSKWHAQIGPYVYSKDMVTWPDISTTGISDSGGWKESAYWKYSKHYLTQDYENIYEQVTLNFRTWISETPLEIKFDLNGGNIDDVTDTITKPYEGTYSDYSAILGATPKYSGYVFQGWTKTKNGTDYVTTYTGEKDLTIYASWCLPSELKGFQIYEMEDSEYNGIKIGIVNPPENHYRRTWFINGVEAGGESKDKPSKYLDTWYYPFTEPGKSYQIYVEYSDKNYNSLGKTKPITIKAASGVGEFKLTNNPSYKIEDNILKWITEPKIQLGTGNIIDYNEDVDKQFFVLELASIGRKPEAASRYSGTWNYLTWNWMGRDCKNYNLAEKIISTDKGKETQNNDIRTGNLYDYIFKLSYHVENLSTGNYTLILYNWGNNTFDLDFSE